MGYHTLCETSGSAHTTKLLETDPITEQRYISSEIGIYYILAYIIDE